MQRQSHSKPPARIRVVGVGGGGVAAVNGLIKAGIDGLDFLTIDNDPVSEEITGAGHHIQIGRERGEYGFNGNVERGRQAANASAGAIQSALRKSDLVFIVAGLGGGAGGGGAPIIADLARKEGAVVMSLVTLPFSGEDRRRLASAEKCLRRLRASADTSIVIQIERLLAQTNGSVGVHEIYRLVHPIWRESIEGVSDMLNNPGLINVDFADVRAIVSEGATAVVATGQASGQDRAQKAARYASRSQMLGITINGARGLLVNIAGSSDMSLKEVEDAATIIARKAKRNANVILGTTVKESLVDSIKITVLATGFQAPPMGRLGAIV